MGSRPLRLHYDRDVSLVAADDLGSVVEPWTRHRRRFLDEVVALDDTELDAPTRCGGWTGRDVLSHLVVVDGFFVASLLGAKAGAPTTFLPGFDPTDTPEQLVAPMRDTPTREIVDDFAAGTTTLLQTVGRFEPQEWTSIAESPMGHVTARLVLAHAHWDSWVHERDILVPLDAAPAVDADELFVSTWYALFVGCVQGGLLKDPAPVGPGPEAPIDVQISLDELPDRPLRIEIDDGVRISAVDPPGTTGASVSALGLVDAFTGRDGDLRGAGNLPEDLLAQLDRGRQIL